MGKKRQREKKEQIRDLILSAARKIVSQDGVQGLSVRKITNEIDYSPAIIYHYFKDKEEIIGILCEEGYKRILNAIRAVEKNEKQPEKEIRAGFLSFIDAILEFPEEYKAFVLSDNPLVTKKNIILRKGISKTSPAMTQLTSVVQRGIDMGRFVPGDAELTAQIMWTSVFGLILKLTHEKGIPKEQKDQLIDYCFRAMFRGLLWKKGEDEIEKMF
ncbi:MAG: TetR/AcrR family transcriptional regulator [Alkaliphilus sp.]